MTVLFSDSPFSMSNMHHSENWEAHLTQYAVQPIMVTHYYRNPSFAKHGAGS